MDYIPLVLGLGAVAGLITYVELTLRRERLSGLRARQSIIDRRLLRVQSAIDRIERRLDAMTVDREVVDVEGRAIYSPAPPSCIITVNGPVDKAVIVKLLDDEMAAMAERGHGEDCAAITPSPQPCLDCGLIGAHVANCALNMDDLVESPTDAAARRGRD